MFPVTLLASGRVILQGKNKNTLFFEGNLGIKGEIGTIWKYEMRLVAKDPKWCIHKKRIPTVCLEILDKFPEKEGLSFHTHQFFPYTLVGLLESNMCHGQIWR